MISRYVIGGACSCLLAALLAACGGGGGGGGSDSDPAVNQPPVATVTAPAEGQTFRAGETLAFTASATDAEDGALPDSDISWHAELHHDTHSHPFVQSTPGGSGSATIPVRGEVSANIYYRFHFIATDSAGARTEVTRDVLPQKVQLSISTVPAGLQVTLDGQPAATPLALTGVVGIERDLGAAEQNFNGRRYVFSGWNDGGAATHVISTPVADTSYVATFTDAGPAVNTPPAVSFAATATATVGTPLTLTATAADSDGSVAQVEFLDGAAVLGTSTSTTSPYTFAWTPATAGAHSLTVRATDNSGATATSAAVAVAVAPAGPADTQAPTATLTAPINFAANLAAGPLNITATAADNVAVASVEFQIDGQAIGAADTAAPYAASIDTTLYASGQHVVRARALDAAGNASAWSPSTVSFAGTRDVSQGFTKNESWVTGLGSATSFVQAPDGRVFVAQQGGAIRVVKNGVLLPTAFHSFTVDATGERGLVGITLHPSFATNGRVFVYYTSPTGGAHNRISSLVANGDVSTGVETVLQNLPNLSGATNHNGGALHFGADGKLYVGVGDNANSAQAPNLSLVFGKLLRFNDDGSIPGDNPFFATQTGLAQAIWARGLRNPFTFAVQPGTGRIHINDVGEGTWEEINLGAPGANYGWPASEGSVIPPNMGITPPIFTYRHSATTPPGTGAGGFFTGISIAGGAFYPATGGTFPTSHAGNYFFADYGSQVVGRLDLANGNAAYAFGRVSGSPVDMMTGLDGALYVLTRSNIVRIGAP